MEASYGRLGMSEAVLEHLGVILRRLKCVLWVSCSILRAACGRLRGVFAFLEPSCGRLVGVFRASWRRLRGALGMS